jgi:hypothetical protein
LFLLRQDDEFESTRGKWLTVGESYLSPVNDIDIKSFVNSNDDDLKLYFNGYSAVKGRFLSRGFTSFMSASAISGLNLPKQKTIDPVVPSSTISVTDNLNESDLVADTQLDAALEEFVLDLRTIVADLIGKVVIDVDKIQTLHDGLKDLRDPQSLKGIEFLCAQKYLDPCYINIHIALLYIGPSTVNKDRKVADALLRMSDLITLLRTAFDDEESQRICSFIKLTHLSHYNQYMHLALTLCDSCNASMMFETSRKIADAVLFLMFCFTIKAPY